MTYSFTDDEYNKMATGLHAEASNYTVGEEDWIAIARAGIAEVNRVPVPPVTSGPSFRSFWINWNGYKPTQAEIEKEAARRSYVMLNAWDHELATKLKTANPKLKVFCYKDASSTRSYDSNPNHSLLPTGVSYQTAMSTWFLTDSSNRRLQYSGYSGHWQMDVGNGGYQAEWATNVVQMKRNWPVWDGILVDNLLWEADSYHDGVVSPKYPSDAAMQTAYKSFLGNVTPTLRSAGLLVIGNLSNARLGLGRWDAYTQYLDGGWDEWWLTFSDTNILPEYTEGWTRQVREITDNDRVGKITLVSPHMSVGTLGVRAFTYALASYYIGIGKNTKAAFMPVSRTDGYGAPSVWSAEQSYDLGQPTQDGYSKLGPCYLRTFERGVVVVNTASYGQTSTKVPLGDNYISKWGTTVNSVTLVGCEGAIFRRV